MKIIKASDVDIAFGAVAVEVIANSWANNSGEFQGEGWDLEAFDALILKVPSMGLFQEISNEVEVDIS